ncbi:MAG: NAD(P)H-hydrate dehydratase [Pirellula sp.]|nr:NAD(P)H-hydrate dehydratase [Pirellula sp.]
MLDQKLPNLQSRSKESHKGSFGHALMIGGARGMGGAIAIAGMACLRSGAGLVTLAVPATSLDLVASFHPCYMTVPLACDDSGRLLRSSLQQLVSPLEKATCVAIGPGLGRSADSDAVVETIFKTFNKNVIFDADALNAISDSEPWLRLRADRSSLAHGSTGSEVTNRILTPHPGEWQRLSGVLAQDREGQKSIADEIAGHTKSVILLKGHRTYITDGSRSFENETGNASMAAGGNGDCLTGIIAALVCQGMSCLDAARLGAHLHGLAGDIAHQALETPSTLATDLIQYIPKAFRTLPQR